MILGIVGHELQKFTPETEALARAAIDEAILRHRPEKLCSGHSPLGGVDWWAEDAAAKHGIPIIVHAPRVYQWGAPGGYKERNLLIARDSDVVLCVVVKELPESFKGKRWPFCYHCRKRNPAHAKSGGCWTAWQCEGREWAIIEAPSGVLTSV